MLPTGEELEDRGYGSADSSASPFRFAHSMEVKRKLSIVSMPEEEMHSDDEEDECCAQAGRSIDLPLSKDPITDHYRVSQEILGEGESGKVVAVSRISDGEKFALKVLRDCPKARRELEIHWLAHTHENIVTIVDMYENDFEGSPSLLLVVEYLKGGDLLSRFEKQGSRGYTEKEVFNVMRQIGSAVQYLHDQGIAHRDIKLENILCSSTEADCVYKLGDFGFAKRPERNALMQSPCCTPYYVSPEVLRRERYDKSVDMWALGVVMYILLCGYPPFYSMSGRKNSFGMRTRISQGTYAFPHEEWDAISDETKEIVKSLLKTVPAERLTIHDLMSSIDEVSSAYSVAEAVPEKKSGPVDLFLSVRLPREGINAPRLHSIQEEIGEPRCSPLLARRRAATMSIKQPIV
ncbi:hypothetical protein PMAYCL1PPCAC_16499 [Pristionchus mayeri]|uniref:non-specific serine/threonine protein kinase n=1 Tax=Pristionchus mayeri TaxID=1317129 RepID=A0AAN5HZC8_9BILA|nr:hypothetical protein PMAYCL1PPCAC_16499 [Pristionchus mayeri]